MSIAALPPATVRAIGSGQVLTDSSSVVKELVDNALDARASSISVEISVNTLDTIRVVDNGHGIAPIDRGLLCRRYCTSKISSFEDISSIGGRYLGFRGEALASMAELSGGVTIVTRIEGEPTATHMEMNRLGELVTQRQVSNSIGTSVSVKEFLKTIPVRREAALKGLNKMYAKTKAILQAYALARPSVRLSFKVLKAKNEKANWTYSPAPGVSLLNAALQVLDQNAVKQCVFEVWPPIERETGENPPVESEAREISVIAGSLKIEALVPGVDCDLAAVNHVGQFVSIDSRPVTCARGTFKQLKGLFRTYLQNVKSSASTTKLVDPILVMNFQCVPGAYDPNVEPSKDDVLFANEPDFLQSVETFFKKLYGERTSGNQKLSLERSGLGQSGFDLLLSRRRNPEMDQLKAVHPDQPRDHIASLRSNDAETSTEASRTKVYEQTLGSVYRPSQDSLEEPGQNEMDHHQEAPVAPSLRDDVSYSGSRQSTPSYLSNMYAADDELFLPPDDPPLLLDEEADEGISRSAQTLNPWVVAKMNASVPRREHSELNGEAPASFIGQLPTPARQRADAYPANTLNPRTINAPKQYRVSLPTPSRSRPRYINHHQQSQSSPLQHQLSNSSGRRDYHSVPHPDSSPQSLSNQVVKPTSIGQTVIQPTPSNQQQDFISARALPLELNTRPQSSPHPDLPWALSYEHRKSLAASQHRAQQRRFQQRPSLASSQHRQLDLSQDVRPTSPTSSSPHANRYAKAIAGLHASQETGLLPAENRPTQFHATEPVLDPRDPRARLMRLQEQQKGGTDTSRVVHQLKRVKTSMLPFESVPSGEENYALSCVVDIGPTAIEDLASMLNAFKEEENACATATGFSAMDSETFSIWEDRLREAVRDLYKVRENVENYEAEIGDGEFEMDLRALLSDDPSVRTEVGEN